MTNASFNLAMLDRHPNWYDHLGAVEAAMAEQDRIAKIRWQAGWDADEGGWVAPDGTSEFDWEHEFGFPFPEDPGYAEWAESHWAKQAES